MPATDSSTGYAALQRLGLVVEALEADPSMRKGQLLQRVVEDSTIDWEALYPITGLKGRHRRKRRWKQCFVMEHILKRVFPRGGSRHGGRPLRSAPPPGVGSVAAGPTAPPVRLLKAAPWFVDIQELAPFRPEEVWVRFEGLYPVLAIYRAGWVATPMTIASPPSDLVLAEWDALWLNPERLGLCSLLSVGQALQWPSILLADAMELLVPMARLLWPAEPWDEAEWVVAVAPATWAVRRAAVPYLRRTASLVHGFQVGGCSARGVWEAMRIPTRQRKEKGTVASDGADRAEDGPFGAARDLYQPQGSHDPVEEH